jgi:hypothetical protein
MRPLTGLIKEEKLMGKKRLEIPSEPISELAGPPKFEESTELITKTIPLSQSPAKETI